MKIKNIHIENYKTYRLLDLDFEVSDERPIVLIGGGNGCGKTTLFDAIYHALYGLEIKNARHFEELFNAGVKNEQGMAGKLIVLQVDFDGMVLGRTAQYSLQRSYMLTDGRVRESVVFKFGGNKFVYGSASSKSDRMSNEEVVNKIISANLPAELSKYFLFDAMKTSELLKEEEINKLIEKNINSVMGFNKYAQLRNCATQLLDEKKAERMQNEEARQAYTKLTHKRQQLDEDQHKLEAEYRAALAYATDHKDEYEQMLSGKNADDVTRDKMRQLETSIADFEKRERDYRKDADELARDLETRVIFPKLADVVRTQVELVLSAKAAIASANKALWTEEEIEQMTQRVVSIIERKGGSLGAASVRAITEELYFMQKDNKVEDEYSYLTSADVEVLDRLVHSGYANPFVPLDEKREQLAIEQDEQPRREEQLKEYQLVISGHDYSIIESYRENEKRTEVLKQKIDEIGAEIKRIDKEIQTYDYDIPQVPDPQYDLLCKLPDFFKALARKLLRAKKTSIERMMKDELNKNLVIYSGVIGRVELSAEGSDDIAFKIFHKNGNEIYLSQLNAGAKQTVMQVLLKVLYKLGDYEPPVMIDTVMGVLDKESREVILERYFPDLAHQTILLSTDTEITTERDLAKIAAYVSKVYTLHRDKEAQCTSVTNDYFGEQPQEQ